MWTKVQLQELLKQVQYRKHQFKIIDKPNLNGFLLQLKFTAPCMVTKHPQLQSGRKWYISPHMTQSEIIHTAFKAVLTAEEHEIREAFLYRNQAIFAPHLCVNWLSDRLATGLACVSTRKGESADEIGGQTQNTQ